MKSVSKKSKSIDSVKIYQEMYTRIIISRDILVDTMNRLTKYEKQKHLHSKDRYPHEILTNALVNLDTCLDNFVPFTKEKNI